MVKLSKRPSVPLLLTRIVDRKLASVWSIHFNPVPDQLTFSHLFVNSEARYEVCVSVLLITGQSINYVCSRELLLMATGLHFRGLSYRTIKHEAEFYGITPLGKLETVHNHHTP